MHPSQVMCLCWDRLEWQFRIAHTLSKKTSFLQICCLHTKHIRKNNSHVILTNWRKRVELKTGSEQMSLQACCFLQAKGFVTMCWKFDKRPHRQFFFHPLLVKWINYFHVFYTCRLPTQLYSSETSAEGNNVKCKLKKATKPCFQFCARLPYLKPRQGGNVLLFFFLLIWVNEPLPEKTHGVETDFCIFSYFNTKIS